MTDKERFVACILGETVDRPCYYLFFDLWKTTWKRWEKEGKPESVTDHRSIFNPDQHPMSVPVNYGPCPKIERSVISENDEFIVFIDEWGIKRRDFKNSVSMSEFIESPVKTRSDWERFKKERLNPDSPERLDGNWIEQCKEWTEKGYPIQLGSFPDVALFGVLRWLLGAEECLVAFYTMPRLVHEIMDHLTSLYLTVFQKVVKIVPVDVIHLWEDMCGKQGPLISPKHWDEFMGPNYRRIRKFADKHNIPIMSIDTDGNPDLIIPSMMRAGVNCLYPMEVAAGCDVNVFRDKYPTLGMMGGVDKRALAAEPAAIHKELARIAPAIDKGCYVPTLDHVVPDNVSWQNYCYYAETLKKLIGKT